MKFWRMFRLAAALVAATGLWISFAFAQTPTKEPGHYFLVIDHSGSMLTPLSRGPEAGRTRWDLMRERAAGFVERLPQGSEAWVIIFSAKDPQAPALDWYRTFAAKLDSAADREKIVGLIKSFPEPGPANGTWLYQATDKALEQVEIAGARNPEAFLTVMVYTDGVDEGHGRMRAEIVKNPGSQISRAQLETRIKQAHQRYRNFNVLNVYQPGDESIRDAHVIRLVTNRLQLANPLVVPKQDLPLEFAFRDSEKLKLAGRPLTLTLEAQDARPLPLRLTGSPFRLAEGKLVIGIERAGDWPAGQDVTARLKIGYPEIEGSYLVAEGGSSVDVLIQGAEAPTIRDVLPAAGSVFPVGRGVSFSLTTLPGATVDWNFGDGQAAKGNPVTHAFTEPGKRTVTVKVTDPRTQLNATASLPTEFVRLGLKLDPLPSPLVPEHPVTLTATSEGDFDRFEWNIDGRVYAGSARRDGTTGAALTLSFERPGPVRISLVGEGKNGGRAETASITANVTEVPALRVTSPANPDTLYFGSTREFRAEIEGVKSQRVRFSLIDANGEELLPAKEVDVSQQGPLRVAVVAQSIPVLKGKVPAIVRTSVPDTTPPLVRDVQVTLEREATTIEVMFPDGREPYINRATSLRIQANAPLKDLRWDFGDGGGLVPGNEVERHVWKRYGDYLVRAVAVDPDGNEVESGTVAIKVPVRPVAANAELIYEGKVVGRDTDRVPINSTLVFRSGVVGDVQRLRWFLDDVELPTGQESLTVVQRGKRNLRLVAEGTPEAGSVQSSLEFRTSDPYLYWGGLATIVAFVAAMGRLLLGNRSRLAEFRIKTDGDKWDERDSSGDLKLEGEFMKLGRGDKFCGRWNPWSKSAQLHLQSLDSRLQGKLKQEGYTLDFNWKTNDTVEFRGPENKLLPCGRLGNDSIRVKANSQQLNADPTKAGSWLACWLVPRPAVPSKRPTHAHPGPSYASLAIYMRLSKAGFASRRWPEMLFVTLCVLALIAARLLHLIFY